MTLKQAIRIIKRHNKWRKGVEIPMEYPKRLSEAIDLVLENIGIPKQKSKWISSKGYPIKFC